MWLLLLLFAAPAAAQPACTPGREGQLACLAGRLCACRFETGGSLTGRPSAHRWDCGVLRPDCRPDPIPPATPMPYGIFPNVTPGNLGNPTPKPAGR